VSPALPEAFQKGKDGERKGGERRLGEANLSRILLNADGKNQIKKFGRAREGEGGVFLSCGCGGKKKEIKLADS